ncbi:MAG: hypothetical protein DRR19_21780 [Candidatus Parabeggiatoa sp. nov. 1]|nr:MAG: hypothetical protein DRR19_21780 [Gammaproteobacteria bacterium]
MKWLLVMLMTGVTALASFYWAKTPIPSAANQLSSESQHLTEKDCSSCHENSIPLMHNEEFLKNKHGELAQANRQLCLSCHDQEDKCLNCHLSTFPEWETDAFRHPDRGPKERDEHSVIASAHKNSCMECHTQHFQKQCANCHRPDEWSYKNDNPKTTKDAS